jgi:NADH dehydrogenase
VFKIPFVKKSEEDWFKMAINRVCILGGSGFVGSHLAAKLSRQGVACRILTRHPHRHAALRVNPGVSLVQADLFDTKELARIFTDCDGVINLIGILNESGRKTTFRRYHVELAEQIVEASLDAGIGRLLHMSALHADEARGSSLYLRSKGEGENRIHTHGGANIKITSFRPSVIFGPGDSFFNRFAGLLQMTPLIFPLACPKSKFAPVFVGDVADAFAKSLNDPTTFGKHYDLCGPECYTLKQLVNYTAESLGIGRAIVGLGDGLSKLQAQIFERLPGKPFSIDNYHSLQTDSICESDGCAALGIIPKSIHEVVPQYLGSKAYRERFYEYRKPS